MATASQIAWFVLTTALAALMWCAQVGPEDANSNLSKWAIKLGVHHIPGWLRARSADRFVLRWGKILFSAFVILGLIGLSSLPSIPFIYALILAVATALAVYFWAGAGQLNRFYAPTVTQNPPKLSAGLRAYDIRFTFHSLANDRSSELTMRIFNGTGKVIELSKVTGHIKFQAPNDPSPSHSGELPPPLIGPNTARTVEQLREWFLFLNQPVKAVEADKILAMIENNIPIHFDLSGLKIEIFAQDDRRNVDEISLHGVSYSKGNGFGIIISATANIGIGSAVKIG